MLDSDESEEEEERNEEEEDDEDDDKPKKKDDDKGKKTPSKNNSRAGTPTPDSPGTAASDEKSARAEKRKAIVDTLMDINEPSTSKRSRMETFGSASSSSSQQASAVEAAFEEDVRRYLARKPMTTTELLKKFKLKKTGLPKEELMPLLVNVIKRINPHKQKVKGTMYLSLKK
jgi:transcription initiation factor TFIIF subunit alpha